MLAGVLLKLAGHLAHHTMQTVADMFFFIAALQMVCLDLLMVLIIPACIIVNSIAGFWVFKWHMCVIIGFFFLLLSVLTRTLQMAVFVLDRFLNIFARTNSLNYIESKVTGVLSWILALVASVIPLPGILDCYHYSPPSPSFASLEECAAIAVQVYNGLFWIVIGVPACSSHVILYIVFFTAKQEK